MLERGPVSRWRAIALGALSAMAVAGCSDLDPIVGTRAVRASPATPGSDAGALAEDDGGNVVLPGQVSFRVSIRPLFDNGPRDPVAKGCKSCHDSREPSHVGIDFGGFDSSTLGKVREGGGSTGRRIIVPFHPESSPLVTKLTGEYGIGARMPKNGPPFWTDAQVALVAQWIAEGAKGEDDE
jgi:hypothetical protein